MGHFIVGLDDLSTGTRSNLAMVPNLQFIFGCATSRAAVAQAVEGVDLVIHLASVVGQLRVRKDPTWAASVSIDSVRLLLNESRGTALVYISSSAVYGLVEEPVCREEAHLSEKMALDYDGGNRGYAFGKFEAERIVLSEQSKRKILIVRPFNVVGPVQGGTYGMVLPRFVENALQRKTLEIFDDGGQARSFSHIGTFVESLLRLIDIHLAALVSQR